MERVCVTGAGGYAASWVVKILLSKGYMVHGTVRDPCDEKKNGHLKKLENAEEMLLLFKADLLDYDGLCAAIDGCTGVLHVASPVPLQPVSNPEVELLEPAITGTRNVLNACLKAKVKKVVVVSSVGAVVMNPNWPSDRMMDESCWSDIEYCKTIEKWYLVSKTIAELEAIEYGRRSEVNIVTICPSYIFGPLLQSTVNASSLLLLSFIREFLNAHVEFSDRADGNARLEDKDYPFVDVRDLAEAILLVYEKPEAQGRYICSPHNITTRALVEKLKSLFPGYNYPKSFIEAKQDTNFNSQKLMNLGWKFRPLEETFVDAVKNYEETGLLGKADA